MPNETFEIIGANHQALLDKYLIKLSDNEYDKCKIRSFDLNLSSGLNYTIENCNSWVFSTKYFGKTMVTDVDFNRYSH
jgi:hypothetical protein